MGRDVSRSAGTSVSSFIHDRNRTSSFGDEGYLLGDRIKDTYLILSQLEQDLVARQQDDVADVPFSEGGFERKVDLRTRAGVSAP